MRRLREVVGSDWVFTDDQDIGTYLDAYTPFRADDANQYVPSGAIAPADVGQVQKIVALANEYELPLWPVSCGRNLGYGGSAPRLSGTLVLDLKRMNRILEVDEHRAYALVEPGVSYFDFYRHLQQHKLKLWMDCADPGWGSLIGNAMDRGLGHAAYRDHFGSICGLEVVLPNGDLMRTGSGAIPDSRTWNLFPYGFGPHVAPMFGQANLGIVTKAGFNLQPEPEASRSDHIRVPRYEDIHPFLDIMSTLTADFTLDTGWSTTYPLIYSRDPDVQAALAKSGGEPSAEVDRLAREKDLPWWGADIRLNGTAEVIDAKWAYIQRRLSSIPGVTFKTGSYFRLPQDYATVTDVMDGDIQAKTALGVPSLGIFSLGAAARAFGHIFFSPIVPMSGVEVLRARKVFRKAYQDFGVEHSGIVNGTGFFRCTFLMMYVHWITADARQNEKTRALMKHLIEVAADNGWDEYRTPPVFMDTVMAAHSFNNHALLRFHETIKDAVDPNGILAPGRAGIWPKGLREKRPG